SRPGRSRTRRGRGTTCGSLSSRRARPSRTSAYPLLLLSSLDEEGELFAVLLHFGDAGPLPEDRPRRTRLHALATRRTRGRLAPRLRQVRDHERLHAAPGHVPGVRPLDLVARPHAASAENAAVVIDAEALVRHVNRVLRVQ